MRLPNTAHTSRPWRIHEFTSDFRVEDVWALPTPGGPDDFPRLVQRIAAGDPSRGASLASRALFAIRWKIGRLLGWDRPGAGLGSRVATLRDRLPADLRDAPSGPDLDGFPFSPLYLTDDEFAAEIANRTMHGVLHLGWVPGQAGGYLGQMAVLVKPNGLLGTGYMAAIRPFRHLIVYPALMRHIEQAWRAPQPSRSSGMLSPSARREPDPYAHTNESCRQAEVRVAGYCPVTQRHGRRCVRCRWSSQGRGLRRAGLHVMAALPQHIFAIKALPSERGRHRRPSLAGLASSG